MNIRRFPLQRAGWYGLGVGALTLMLAACDTGSLVDLQDPDLITGPVARDTANVAELRNGALFEFARAVSGPAGNNATPGIVGLTGLMTDELWYASTFPTMKEVDSRNIDVNNSGLLSVYQYIHRARNLTDRVAEQYIAAGRENTADYAMMANLSGFTTIFLAENFCSGVPLSSTALTGDLEFGPPQTTAQLLDTATTRFETALAHAQAANAVDQQNLARIGQARALLARGEFDAAAALVAAVPTDFAYEVAYSNSSSGQNNGVWYNINTERRSSAASGEGQNGVVFFKRGPAEAGNDLDPRVSVDSTGMGSGVLDVPHYRQTKYGERGAGIPLATGIEARLIEAEAALSKGTSASYLPILNALRAEIGLADLTDPGAGEPRVRQFFEERAFWLWLTGHRLGDLRRMVKFYGFEQDEVFPTGQTIFGSPYGSDVNLPIPFQERNNPEYSGQCIDRNA